MIQLKNLTKIYQTDQIQTIALNRINLTINYGDFISIMGPSGCGKSTLLNILGLIDHANSGSFLLNNREVININEKKRSLIRKQNIGFIFQNFYLISEMPIYDNIELPLLYNKVPSVIRKKKIYEIAERLSISHRLNHYPRQLSGGQQQRTAVARALIHDPKIVLADEPTGNLDSVNRREVMELIADIHAQGTTVLMVTHSNIDATYAQKTINMKDGRIFSEKYNNNKIDILINPPTK